jgi:mono/diheme cytochrome c family protein
MAPNRYQRLCALAISLTGCCGVALGVLLSGAAAEAPAVGPPSAEQPARDPHAAAPSSNPVSGKLEAIEAGRKLYFMWCVQCHGPKADGVARFGKYAGDLRAFWRGYREFITIVKNGRPQQQMPPWKEVLSEPQIAQVGAYLETLAIEGASWK